MYMRDDLVRIERPMPLAKRQKLTVHDVQKNFDW